MDPAPAAPSADPARVAALRADLTAADYTVDRLRDLWGADADAALTRGDRIPALRALRSAPSSGGADDPAGLLARLWLLADPLDDAELARALPSLGADGASALGLIAREGSGARGAVDLRPYGVVDGLGAVSWWVVSDLGETQTGGALREDHVLGVGGASATLAGLQLPDAAGSVLDLGTGCGVQALHASRHAERIVATDLSARALAFARLTLALAGVEADLRLGSLLDPVAGPSQERFDRIVSNPPFVITPRREGVPRYEYRDGGAVGDGLLAALVAGLPRHLNSGGIAQLLGNWEYRPRDDDPDPAPFDGLEAAAAWAERAGLEHWIVERDRVDPARYAETWIRDGGTRPGDPGYETLLEAWLDDFAERGVESIGFGYLLLRAPEAGGPPPLRRTERIPEALGDNPAGLGAHLSRALAARDAIAPLDDGALAGIRFRVAGDVTEERSHWPGSEHPSAIVLRQGGGFARTVRVGTALAAVVGACDGDLPLGAILAAVAELTEVAPDALAAEVIPQVRDLVIGGLLDPVAADA